MAGSDDVYITTLGSFSVSYKGKTVGESKFRDTLSWQLMKYLVANPGRRIDQEELMGVLWTPDGVKDSSFGTMRVRLHRLRESLKAVRLGNSRTGLVLYSSEKYAINPAYRVVTDVDRIFGLYMRAKNELLTVTERLDACKEALALFTGTFFESSVYAEWMERGRAESRELFRALATVTMSLAEAGNDLEALSILSDKVLVMGPEDTALGAGIIRLILSLMSGNEEKSFAVQPVLDGRVDR